MTAPGTLYGTGYIRPEIDHLAVDIHSVHTYPGNARRGNHQRIRDSLLTHGQYKPLLAQHTTGHIVVGNNTLDVMRQQGWTHVAVQFLDLDDTQARKLLLMDNRSSDDADYDTANLVDLLAELPEFAGSGYWEMDVDRLLAELGGTAALDSLPSVTDALPISPAAPAPPAPPAAAPQPRNEGARLARGGRGELAEDTPPGKYTPITTRLPPVLPPAPRPPGPAPDAPVDWHLNPTRTDREEALRLIAHAREWLEDPHLTPAQVVMRALRTLAAIGDARHNPTAQINITTLLMAAGRDPFRSL